VAALPRFRLPPWCLEQGQDSQRRSPGVAIWGYAVTSNHLPVVVQIPAEDLDTGRRFGHQILAVSPGLTPGALFQVDGHAWISAAALIRV
jgi:hypothetical protein